jgi:hypothetical protein
MHVDNTYLTNRTAGQAEQLAATPDASKRAGARDSASPSGSTPVASRELLDLADQLRQTPEVRREAVQRVAQRLASGFYSTRAAAAETAEAIQRAQD